MPYLPGVPAVVMAAVVLGTAGQFVQAAVSVSVHAFGPAVVQG